MLSPIARCGFSIAALTLATSALAQEKFTYVTNWYAQAEHGGFYQALADGSYKAAGLDVTIRMGGPQVNIMQIMAAGQAECVMGYDVQTIGTALIYIAAVLTLWSMAYYMQMAWPHLIEQDRKR